MTLFGVGTAVPGVTIALYRVKDALKAQGAGRRRDFVISIALQHTAGISNEETKVSTLGESRGRQAIN
jgi:hypothetical protein